MAEHSLSSQLQFAAAMRGTSEQIFWSCAAIFGAAQALLATRMMEMVSQDWFRSLLLCLVGAFSALMWTVVQRRLSRHLSRNERLVMRIEQELQIRKNFCLSLRLNDEDYQEYIVREGWFGKLSIRWAAMAVAVTAWFGWNVSIWTLLIENDAFSTMGVFWQIICRGYQNW